MNRNGTAAASPAVLFRTDIPNCRLSHLETLGIRMIEGVTAFATPALVTDDPAEYLEEHSDALEFFKLDWIAAAVIAAAGGRSDCASPGSTRGGKKEPPVAVLLRHASNAESLLARGCISPDRVFLWGNDQQQQRRQQQGCLPPFSWIVSPSVRDAAFSSAAAAFPVHPAATVTWFYLSRLELELEAELRWQVSLSSSPSWEPSLRLRCSASGLTVRAPTAGADWVDRARWQQEDAVEDTLAAARRQMHSDGLGRDTEAGQMALDWIGAAASHRCSG